MNSEFEQMIDLAIKTGQVGHAYLVEVEDNYFETLKNIVKKLLITVQTNITLDESNDMVENAVHPDVVVVNPDGLWIKKEQITKLQEQLSTKSMYNCRRIYIIDKAEQMNKAANNSLLKFLEEPSDNIIGILITNSKNHVMKTIKSRCQSVSIKKYEDVNINEQTRTHIRNLLELPKCKYTTFFKMIGQFDRKELIDQLVDILKGYELILNNNSDIIDGEISVEILLRHMSAIAACIDNLKYNTNIKLSIDKLYYEMFEVV